MKREEIEKFVRKTVNEDPSWDGEYECCDSTVQAIADAWEQDAEERWQNGVYAGQESVGE